MTNCNVDMSHPMYGYNTQDKDSQITVSITEDIKPCVRWKANKQTAIPLGTLVQYVRKDVPVDQINCNPSRCMNTGTLYVMPNEAKTSKVQYQVRSVAKDFALGFNMIYLKLMQLGRYELKVAVSDFFDTTQENSYIYTYEFTNSTPGYVLRTIDFADTRVMTQTGTGWKVSDRGVNISYQITYKEDTSGVGQVGFSTPMIVNDRSELRKFSNVLLSCLTSFTHNVSLPASDARCFGRAYDQAQVEITKEITATTTSCNDYWLNPLQSMSRKMTSGVPVTDTFPIEEVTVDGKRYGSFVIPDLYYEDCNTIIISSDRCDCTYLSMLPTSAGVELEDDEFIALTAENAGVERGTVLVNPMYIGEKLLVTYNGERDVELIVANDKRLRNTKFRVTQMVENTRGIKEYYVFNNVLVTEISRDYVTEGEITLSLSFTVSRDENGNFYEIRRNVEDIA